VAITDGIFHETLRPTANLADLQRYMYNTHYKGHGFLYFHVTVPNGLVAGLGGPFGAANNDAGCFRAANMPAHLQSWVPYKLLCDAIYPASQFLCPMPAANTYAPNVMDAIRACRTPVEHGFAVLLQTFPYLRETYKHNMVTKSGVHWTAATVLLNCITCLEGGNQVSSSFNCVPPTLSQYLRR